MTHAGARSVSSPEEGNSRDGGRVSMASCLRELSPLGRRSVAAASRAVGQHDRVPDAPFAARRSRSFLSSGKPVWISYEGMARECMCVGVEGRVVVVVVRGRPGQPYFSGRAAAATTAVRRPSLPPVAPASKPYLSYPPSPCLPDPPCRCPPAPSPRRSTRVSLGPAWAGLASRAPARRPPPFPARAGRADPPNDAVPDPCSQSRWARPWACVRYLPLWLS